MPVFVTWLLSTTGPTVSSLVSAPAGLPPVLGAEVECAAPVLTFDDLIEIARRAYPADYFDALQSRPDAGFEIIAAACAVMARVSVAVARRLCCSFVIHASGGRKATGEVEFYRDAADAGALTVKVGSIVRTLDGRDFVTTADAVFAAPDLVSTPAAVGIEAIAVGYEWNVQGTVVTESGITLEGDIVVIKKPRIVDHTAVDEPPKIDLELRVRNPAPTAGGRDACLDALGQDVLLPRLLGESDDAYRYRIQTTPDTVSPAAIRRIANGILSQFGLGVCLREVGTPLLPGLFYDAGSSLDSPQEPRNNYAYDFDFDVRPEDRFKLYLDTIEMRGFFLLGVPLLIEQENFGFIYDGTTADPFPIKNAYDTPEVDAPNATYDGFLLLSAATYKAISDAVAAAKAAGVGFDLYIEEIGCF